MAILSNILVVDLYLLTSITRPGLRGEINLCVIVVYWLYVDNGCIDWHLEGNAVLRNNRYLKYQ